MGDEYKIPAGARVLITGATGFTGSVLVRKLVLMNAEVTAIARHSSNISALEKYPIKWVRGDVADPETVKTAVSGVEYIFHVAAAYREAGLPDDTYRQVHVESTRLLAESALNSASFKRFVHISTVGVHGHVDNPPADENSPFNPGDIYQQTKAEAEMWLHSFAAKNKLPYTVIRPAAIYGPGDKRLLKLFKMAVMPLCIILGDGKTLYHLVHVEDLTDAILLAAVHPLANGEAFICGSPSATTIEGICRVVANTLNKPFRPVHLPAAPFFWLAAMVESASKLLKIEPFLYKRRVAFFTKDRSFNTQKIREKIGFTNKISDNDGISQTALWYKEKGWL